MKVKITTPWGADDDGDLVDASTDIRYDLEWESGAWLDYTSNE